MNLFVTSACPYACAEALDDKRMVKAVLETAQLLSTAFSVGYSPTHAKHPVTLWVQASLPNAVWTYYHFTALCTEFSYRYAHSHACEKFAPDFRQAIHEIEPALRVHKDTYPLPAAFNNGASNKAVGWDFTHLPVFTAYQLYLAMKWRYDSRTPTWRKRGEPAWLPSAREQLK